MSKNNRNRQFSNNIINVTSIVSAGSLEPLIRIDWGSNQGQFTPDQARDHAFAVLEATSAAELDACLIQWITRKLETPSSAAVKILQLFREKREIKFDHTVTININGERVTPEAARQHATWLLDAAFQADIESLLAAFLLEDVGQTPEAVNQIIEEFREMRGMKTMPNFPPNRATII